MQMERGISMPEALELHEAANLRPATHSTKYDQSKSKVLRTNEAVPNCNRLINQESVCYTHGRLWCSNVHEFVRVYWQQCNTRSLQC